MTFKTQLAADASVFFNTGEFAETATLRTTEGIEHAVSIVRTGQVERMTIEPGQADQDTFEIPRSSSYCLSPNTEIITQDGVVWQVEPGVRLDEVIGIWVAPVLSAGRIKS